MKRTVLLAALFITGAIVLILKVYVAKVEKSVSSASWPKTESNVTIPQVDASEIKSMDSPDGKLTLLLKITKNSGKKTYSFTVSGREIFAKTVEPTVSFSIPYNTWSPDGKYLFLKETKDTGVRFFALSSNMSSSEQNEDSANVTDLFIKKFPELKIEDATGWGGVNLIVFNSLKKDGSKGPSFWFEMPSHAIIQLSNHFD